MHYDWHYDWGKIGILRFMLITALSKCTKWTKTAEATATLECTVVLCVALLTWSAPLCFLHTQVLARPPPSPSPTSSICYFSQSISYSVSDTSFACTLQLESHAFPSCTSLPIISVHFSNNLMHSHWGLIFYCHVTFLKLSESQV